jgi:hypothetical protein
MNFKKDYINYVLYNVINANRPSYVTRPVVYGSSVFGENLHIRNILEKIIGTEDIVKTTFLIGKTAGLEQLFKYLLYMSDKIDKSQITIFNLRDNFDYDVQNVKNICAKVSKYIDEIGSKNIEKIKLEQKKEPGAKEQSTIKVDIDHEKEIIADKVEAKKDEFSEESDGINYDTVDREEQGMTLIENVNTGNKEDEVFELADIDEVSDKEEKMDTDEKKLCDEKESYNDETVISEQILAKDAGEVSEPGTSDNSIDESLEQPIIPENKDEEIELEFEIKESTFDEENLRNSEPVKDESITNEEYLKFENRFFEEVKILEKHFDFISKECRKNPKTGLNDRVLQSCTEIIEISSEFSNLTRQLSFDLTADIFFTINLLFTKTIENPSLLTYERIKLLESSLSLVNSLIKGEDYLNYDAIVEKVEKLKGELNRTEEKNIEVSKEKENLEQETNIVVQTQKSQNEQSELVESVSPDENKISLHNESQVRPETYPEETEKPKKSGQQVDFDSIIFKMKHFVKEFEKTFISLGNLHGEFVKFEAIDKIDELNNSLRMIAKISASMEMIDVLKLSEVTYVFLKYLKDYRMDLLDSEIQQIIKYVIFTFKMLLTERKPEDFNILVQYLNNPVKIFTDSN